MSAGVDGALPPRGIGGNTFDMADRSMLEIAADRRCACPRRPEPCPLSPGPGVGRNGGVGGGFSAFVGLEVIAASRPISSLPRR